MPTFAAPDADTDHDAEIQTLEAWATYREALVDLEGRAYEDAELTAWDDLQEQLTAITR